MINCEPTPCGRFVFGSTLIVTQGRPALLTAKRAIPYQAQLNRRLGDVINELATEVIAELMSQASLCGLTKAQIGEALDVAPEQPIVARRMAKRKAT